MMTPVENAGRGCFVEASAGTGKTHMLVTEIAAAIEKAWAFRLRQSNPWKRSTV